jgi:uncharacterized membrane protein
MMILFLVIGILGSIYLINHFRGEPNLNLDGRRDNLVGEKQSSSLEILDRRLASGEISQNEYAKIKNIIIDNSEY